MLSLKKTPFEPLNSTEFETVGNWTVFESPFITKPPELLLCKAPPADIRLLAPDWPVTAAETPS